MAVDHALANSQPRLEQWTVKINVKADGPRQHACNSSVVTCY